MYIAVLGCRINSYESCGLLSVAYIIVVVRKVLLLVFKRSIVSNTNMWHLSFYFFAYFVMNLADNLTNSMSYGLLLKY